MREPAAAARAPARAPRSSPRARPSAPFFGRHFVPRFAGPLRCGSSCWCHSEYKASGRRESAPRLRARARADRPSPRPSVSSPRAGEPCSGGEILARPGSAPSAARPRRPGAAAVLSCASCACAAAAPAARPPESRQSPRPQSRSAPRARSPPYPRYRWLTLARRLRASTSPAARRCCDRRRRPSSSPRMSEAWGGIAPADVLQHHSDLTRTDHGRLS